MDDRDNNKWWEYVRVCERDVDALTDLLCVYV